MGNLKTNQLENINMEVSVLTAINNIKFWILERTDFANDTYQILRTDDFINNVDLEHNLTKLQQMMYSAFWLEIEFRITADKIWCSLKCKFELKNGGSNGIQLQRFSIAVK